MASAPMRLHAKRWRSRARATTQRICCAGQRLRGRKTGLSYGESILRPALNVTQLTYGGTGPQRNAIGPEASAGFDIRLTPGITSGTAR